MGADKQIDQDLAEPISKLGCAADLNPGDEFALFRISSGAASSFKLPYGRLVQQAVSDISARFGLSSMAFRDTWEYARFDHQHGYSNVACYPVYDSAAADQSIRLMSFDITDMHEKNHIDVCMPRFDPPPDPEPDIGDVRFLATNSLTAKYGDTHVNYVHILPDGSTQVESRDRFNVNLQITESIENGTFDGWVFPDGQSYFKAQGKYDFTEAYTKFGGRDGVFNVPLMNNFIKANPGAYHSGDALRAEAGQTGLA